jgi:diacylglycerol O-acyltransferase / wax synthase
VVNPVRPLSGLDALFVYLEGLGTPMHVASVLRLAPPARPVAGFAQRLREHLVARLEPLAMLRMVLVESAWGTGHPHWQSLDRFDASEHVESRRLPRPGSRRQLDALVARLHAGALDRSRPPWRVVVIDGLDDGGAALYLQTHHALVDGQAGVQLTAALLDPRPGPLRRRATGNRARLPWPAAGAGPSRLGALAAGLRELPGLLEGAGFGGLVGSLRGSVRLAPRTAFNVQIGQMRRFASGGLPLPELRHLARQAGSSLNDMVLALVGGALREHLQQAGALPARPLVAAMPLSLRSGADAGGNQVTIAQCTLATDLGDPLQRLVAITADTVACKRRLQLWRPLIPTDLPGLGVPLLASALASLWRRGRLAERLPPLANLTLSNVPGPPRPLYLGPVEVRAFHPVSIVMHGLGVNITVLSYCDRLEIGVVSTPETLPQPERLVRRIERQLPLMQRALAAARG